MHYTDFYLQQKNINGGIVQFRACSSCGQKLIENTDPFFNVYCSVASQREQQRLEDLKKQL